MQKPTVSGPLRIPFALRIPSSPRRGAARLQAGEVGIRAAEDVRAASRGSENLAEGRVFGFDLEKPGATCFAMHPCVVVVGKGFACIFC